MVEPLIDQVVVIPAGVPHAALTHHRVLLGARVAAMRDRRHHGELVVPRLRIDPVLADMVEQGQVRADRDIVPGHEPEARHAERLVVVVQAAPVPGRVVRRALDHPSAAGYRRRIRVDTLWPVHAAHEVHQGQVPDGFRPVHPRQFR